MTKAVAPYIGQETSINITVLDTLMIEEYQNGANIMSVMKERIQRLEENAHLKCRLTSKYTLFKQIKNTLGEKDIYETNDGIYFIGNECMVYYLCKKDIDGKDYKKAIEKYAKSIWKDSASVIKPKSLNHFD